jgi:uncharacterized protein YkwD
MKTVCGLILLVLVLATEPLAQQQPEFSRGSLGDAQNTTQAEEVFSPDAERELMRLLNLERQKQGLQPLARDARLEQAARAHALRMAENHLLSHQFPAERELPQRLAGAGIRFDRSGENVAFGPSVEQVHQGLMKSPPHRENILRADYNAAGVGVVLRDGLLWVTQNFARRLEFRREEEVENLLARKFDQLRRKGGQKPLRRETVSGLRQAACEMADRGKLDARRAKELFGGRGGAAAFSGAELSDLPSEWRKVVDWPGLERYAVGVCFRESEQYPSGGYWAVLVFE